MADSDNEHCWICLEEETETGDVSLISPCRCPRKVHPQCLARWQLQQAGKDEEKFCRFCKHKLEDWKTHLTPEPLKPEVSKVQPIMVVYFEGQIHRIPVKNGPDGLTEFTTKIRDLFRLPEDVDISLTFGCKEPMSGQHLKLEGVGAFDAAVHCASVAAADRQQKVKKSHSTGSLGAMTGAGGGAGAGAAGATVPGPLTAGMQRHASSNSIQTLPSPTHGAGVSAAAAPPRPPVAAAAAASPAPRGVENSESVRTVRATTGYYVRSPSAGQAAGGGGAAATSPEPAVLFSPQLASMLHPPPPQHPSAASFRSILSLLGGDGADSTSAWQSNLVGQAAAAGGGGGLGGGGGGNHPPRPPLRQTASHSQLWDGASGPPAPSSHSMTDASYGSRRVRKDRLSSRNVMLTDVPEADETVAVGSLSGKFKLHFKAFSRKVARSLSFSAKSPGSSAAAGGGSGGSGGSPTSSSSSSSSSAASRVAAAPSVASEGSFSAASDVSSVSAGMAEAAIAAAVGTPLALAAHAGPRMAV